MRAVIQRVTHARVSVEGRVTGEIEAGLVVLVAVGREDTPATPATMANKIVNLRIFNDDQGKMNCALRTPAAQCLPFLNLPSTATHADSGDQVFWARHLPNQGKAGYEEFVRALQALNVRVETGVFQAHMSVEIVNDGPVTILLDSDNVF